MVAEYTADELAEDSEDEKRIFNAVSTVPVPASKNFTLNCRYRHFKQKLNDAGMDALST